ncbi:hypothetical protein CVT25_002626 [Psilocybe cyanescens]|uniref:Uncharacterized protein n=1 Tax=Psilocybe cyanescens TaxID=93625 RepID=A0A409WLM7_PSICY|nr:hypothetical protein CVT25_002626 [Psilocybe cyanescens]
MSAMIKLDYPPQSSRVLQTRQLPLIAVFSQRPSTYSMLSISKSPPASKTIIPKTPTRRFLCKFEQFRPNMTLGKRSRHLDYPSTSILDAIGQEGLATTSSSDSLDLDATGRASTATSTELDSLTFTGRVSSIQVEMNAERARLAFQLHDRPLDAVVVTTLPRYPFCCHEDLITMSRQQLVDVAILFNTQLPKTIQIDHSDWVSAAHIRHCIETLVGLIPNIPGAPKAAKSRPLERAYVVTDLFSEDPHPDIVPSPPTSPLAVRYTRRHGVSHSSNSSILLESLEEEDESPLSSKKRVLKKRKISGALDVPTRYVCDTEGDDMDITPIRPPRLSSKMDMSSSPDVHTPGGDTGLLSPLMARLQKRSNRAPYKSADSAFSSKAGLRSGRPGINRFGMDTREQQVNHAIGMYEMETSFHSLGNDNEPRMDISLA